MKAAFLASAVLATAGFGLYFSSASAAPICGSKSATSARNAHQPVPSRALSLPVFFEPNQGQTAPQVKFLARGAGYGLFLTADEAVLNLQRVSPSPRTATALAPRTSSSVIRMKLDGANSIAAVSGVEPLPGKSNYFIGNDPAKWRRNIPQFGRVQYHSVYPGVDLVYYGDQGQLEYDFRVAPGAEPQQIALTFDGASTHIDSGDSGDLILSAPNGDVRFHAPVVYQQAGNNRKPIAGAFRQLAGNKIGFTIGDYDHSRELVIDPVLTYSSYLGGSLTESLVKVAVDAAQMVYVAGSTTSPDFPLPPSPPANPPVQSQLAGQQNIFIAKINTLNPGTDNNGQVPSQLVYATYLGGSGIDSLAGIAVDQNFAIYVAGTTTSPNFPTTGNAFQTGPQTGTHGFLSQIAITPTDPVYTLTYSTYLAGNAVDTVTGIAVDTSENAYVTGVTTSTNPASNGFPANPNGYQIVSNSPGYAQFFASKINTLGSGPLSMLYSTYFGGGNPAGATAIGGGIAVDPSSNDVNMYFTGSTNMLPVPGPNPGQLPFPLFNAQQSCLDQASTTSCSGANPTNTDGFVAKIDPNRPASNPVYSTYIGGSGSDAGAAIAVDTSGAAYVTGTTNSSDWSCESCVEGFQGAYAGVNGNNNGFVVKVGTLVGTQYRLTYFTYLGGTGPDSGQDIKVDSVQQVHVVGSTTSPNFPTTLDAPQPQYGGGESDAFVASLSTTASGNATGDYSTYLGGSQLDAGTGVAVDLYGATYVAGSTQSTNFPVTANAYQGQLNSGSQDAFVTKLGATSTLVLSNPTSSPSPNPVAAGTQVAFTFDITNTGPDNATNVIFSAIVPTTGVANQPTAKVTSGAGTCNGVSGGIITCNIPTLAACTQVVCPMAAVEVDVTPSITGDVTQVSVSGSASANNGPTQGSTEQLANVVNFSISASTSQPSINAGDTAQIQVAFCPTSNLGYNATITPSQSTSPSMVTATTPTFNPTTVTLAGSQCATTTLSIATVARPVTTSSLLRRGSFYAAWLPIGGLSLLGLGLGATRKRRRWLVGAVLGLIAGAILLQVACGSASTSTTTTGGTLAGIYTVTITGSAGTGASQNTQVRLQVN